MEPWMVVLVTLVSAAILFVGYSVVIAGSLARFFAARSIATRWLGDEAFAAKVNGLLNSEPTTPPTPARPSAEPLWLLALLQREGRLLDFLLEDIQAYSNDQIGAAVRDIHRDCKKAIQDHLALEPVMKQVEGETVEVPAGFDPSATQVTGNIAGSPPYRGQLLHAGWRVRELKLSPPPPGQDQFIVQPARVEVG